MDVTRMVDLLNFSYSKVDKRKNKFFHLNSIKNFIKHIDELDIDEKERISNRIYNYLKLINDENSISINKEESLKLFNEYIYPIGKIYENKCGFAIKFTWVGILNVVLIFGLVLIINNIILYFIFIFFSFWYFIPLIKKHFEGKVFGFKY